MFGRSPHWIFALTAFCAAGPLAAAQTTSPARTTITLASLYSTGDYGLDVDTTLQAAVLKLSHRNRTGGISITVPYLSITGPATAVYEDIDTGELFLVDIDDERRSGLGDMVIGVDATIWEQRRKNQKIAIGGSVKLPTGNEEKRLSNGAADWSLFINARTRIKTHLLSGQLGYQIKGDTEFTDYDNRLFTSASLYHPIGRNWGIGAGARFKQPSLDGYDPQQSVNAFITHILDKTWIISLRLNKGLTDAVADYSLGLQVAYRMGHPRAQRRVGSTSSQ